MLSPSSWSSRMVGVGHVSTASNLIDRATATSTSSPPPLRSRCCIGGGGGGGGQNHDPIATIRGRIRGPSRAPVNQICYSWNEGFCRFQPRCQFKHKCTSCGGDHRATECPSRPPPAPRQRESLAQCGS